MKEFDFVRDRFKTVCPMCGGKIRADACFLVECKFKFFKTKITPSSRLEIIEPSEYEYVPKNQLIILDIHREMKNIRWSKFKIIPASLSDYEEYSPVEKCMFCFQIISKHATILEYTKCNHVIHKRCYMKLDRIDSNNCIKCDERDGFVSILQSRAGSLERKKTSSLAIQNQKRI